MAKISEEEFLEECYDFLDYFQVDYSKDTIVLTDGGNSCIMNPKSQFFENFGGHSINSVAEYVAKKLNKSTVWFYDEEENYE